MLFIRVGRRRLQLKYVVMDEEYDGSPEPTRLGPGDVKVTTKRGEAFILTGEAADRYRYYADKETLPPPGAAGEGPESESGRWAAGWPPSGSAHDVSPDAIPRVDPGAGQSDEPGIL